MAYLQTMSRLMRTMLNNENECDFENVYRKSNYEKK